MKCNVCDNEIADKEIQYNPELVSHTRVGNFEPCPTCLESAMDAAYSDGFQYDEDVVSVLDTDFDGDASDIVHSPRNEYE